MPPKKKGKEKKKKGDDGEAKRKDDGEKEPSDKEKLLQQELDQLTGELDSMKQKVEELRAENEWLQQEAHKVRIESHEYMSYMEKKTSKRQTTIISLSDQNSKEIQDIKQEKENMLKQYEEKKATLRAVMLEKENMLSRTKQELEDLQEYKNLQKEQLAKIRELEREVMHMRGKHSETIQSLKAKFLKEKREFQTESEQRIQTMTKQANKEAFACLNDHTDHIKIENRALRHELLKLIRKTRALHEHKAQLEEQKKQLLREQQYANDLKKIRSSRQHQVYKNFGLLDEEEDMS
ncbi:unnamed protein product [Owenia fusiformis]|uniref:Uncharacterized protein n=1 Tax=Owenia fusiformis TaxID=6347 RepID=A0A8J1UP00_OWEFU|nr:unnamed protein product [Owenia fusiformis]